MLDERREHGVENNRLVGRRLSSLDFQEGEVAQIQLAENVPGQVKPLNGNAAFVAPAHVRL